MEEKNALRSANDYLSFMAFSKKGLIEQLKYEGYSTEAATNAVNSLDVDWNEQAAKSAEHYLSFMSFSVIAHISLGSAERSQQIHSFRTEGFSKSGITGLKPLR